MSPLIAFDRVHYQYETAEGVAIPALRDISLEIQEGEFVAVVGANGSGKSTFARLISALLFPQQGRVLVDGLDIREPHNRRSIHAAVGMVFQFPEDQIISTTVEEDVAFGPENLGLPREEIRRRVDAALRDLGLEELRRRPPHLLSAGQTQRVALAGVLAMQPRCVVFDEASTMLDPSGRRALIQAMQRLHAAGTTVITVTHFMDEAALAQRVLVFEQGRLALDAAPAQVFEDTARLTAFRLDLPPAARVAAALRTALPDLPQGLLTMPDLLAALPTYHGPRAEQPQTAYGTGTEVADQPLIEVRGLGFTYMIDSPLAQRALQNADLRVEQGQAHGLLGMTGSGKTTLMQHLNALLHPQEGTVRVGPFDLTDPAVDRRQVVRQVGLVFQNPETQFFEYFVGDEIAFGPRQLGIDEPLSARVRWAMEQVDLDFMQFKDRPLRALSGGERRKVALASTLALKPSILLLDEPTAGLDPYSRRELLNKLAAMCQTGLTIIFSSHRMEDLSRLTSAMTVFHKGEDVLSGPTAQVFTQFDALQQYGMVAPVAVQAAAGMRAKGWPVPGDALTSDKLGEAVRRIVQGVAS